MTLDLARFGFGIPGHTSPDIVRELAPLVEQAGFNSMWFNHTPQGNAFAAIDAAAAVTSTMRLATGVTSLDTGMSATDIVEQVRMRDLPTNRLLLGIGAHQPPSPIRTVRDAATIIRNELPGVPVFIGALGPNMRRFGVREADGVLLNWLTPEAAASALQDRRRDAPDSAARVALYIRCSLGELNEPAMRAEAERYASLPGYAANFGRLGFSALDAAVVATSPEALQAGLAAYVNVVDLPILRAIVAEPSVASYASLVESARN